MGKIFSTTAVRVVCCKDFAIFSVDVILREISFFRFQVKSDGKRTFLKNTPIVPKTSEDAYDWPNKNDKRSEKPVGINDKLYKQTSLTASNETTSYSSRSSNST